MTWRIVIPVFVAVFAVGLAARSMTGAPIDADINEMGVQNAVNFAMVEHNKKSNDMYRSGLIRVVGVQKQVVAGMKYIITVDLGKTACRKSDISQDCAVHEDPQMARPHQCKFTVWSRPWMGAIELLDEKCT